MKGQQQSLERLCEMLRAHGITSTLDLAILAAMGRHGGWMYMSEIAALSRSPSVSWVSVAIQTDLYDRGGDRDLVKRENRGAALAADDDRWALSAFGREAMEIISGQLGDAYTVGEDKTLAAVTEGLGGLRGETVVSTATVAAAELMAEVSRARALVDSAPTAEAIDLDELNASLCRVYQLAKDAGYEPGGEA